MVALHDGARGFRASIESVKGLCDEFLGGDCDVAAASYAPAAVRG